MHANVCTSRKVALNKLDPVRSSRKKNTMLELDREPKGTCRKRESCQRTYHRVFISVLGLFLIIPSLL